MKDLKLHHIENLIFTIRDMQVMIDFHLADLYGTETKRLNEQVKRNAKRFPPGFMFRLTDDEWKYLQSQIATSKRRSLPYVFSEQGVAMLSTVLNSDEAIEASIAILKAFVYMRHFLQQNALLFQRVDQLEFKQFQTEKRIEQVFKALEAGISQPDKGIFFEGQVFDAYSFAADLIKRAKSSIILIDSFIDDKELYHLGASIKDLGKKWFAFSRMDSLVFQVLNQLRTH